MKQRWLKVRALYLLVLVLCACSPRFDWRDVRLPGGLVASFPAHVDSLTRTIKVNGVELSMQMHAARVARLTFAIGVAGLPAGDTSAAEVLRRAVEEQLVRNFSGTVLERHAVRVSPGDSGGAAVAAPAILAEGNFEGQTVWMHALVFVRNSQLYQVMLVGPREELDAPGGRQQAETFLSSLRLG